ncbi:hypothetical protein HDE_00425 [Halotydeus destructor]|nr:hypothetical protein HDE_00425 [Halotydeus destructor]
MIKHDEVESALYHVYTESTKMDIAVNRPFDLPPNFTIERPTRRNRYSPTGYDPAIKLLFSNAAFNVTKVDKKLRTGRTPNVTVANRFDGLKTTVTNFDPVRIAYRVDVTNTEAGNELTICGSFSPILTLKMFRPRKNDADLELTSHTNVKDEEGPAFLHCCSYDRYKCDAAIESQIKAASEFWALFQAPVTAYIKDSWAVLDRGLIANGLRDLMKFNNYDIFNYH